MVKKIAEANHVGDIMKGVVIGIGAAIIGVAVALIGIVAIFLFAILGALMGAITGFIVGFVPVLGPLVAQGFMMIGVQNPNLVALGAMLGFVGGFFKQHQSNTSTCKCK